MLAAVLAAAALLAQQPGTAAPTLIQTGVDNALTACEQWILFPVTWSSGLDGFPVAIGLQDRLQPVRSVPEVALPPPPSRVAMHHWRVPLGGGGIFVTASDRKPVCHLSGGGPDDFEPAIEAELRLPAFLSRWTAQGNRTMADMLSTSYVSRVDPRLTLVVSRANAANARRDRVQFLATASYSLGN